MPTASTNQVAERLFAAKLSLVGGIFILAGKLVAYFLTGSTAVFSDALESVVNVVAAALVWYSVALAAEPADRNHPYGHGKVEFFSAGVEGTLIVVAAVWILFEAGRDLVRGPMLQRLDVGLLIVIGVTLLNAALGGYLLRVGRRTDSIALVADGQHLITDVVTSVGVVLGLGVVWLTGWALLDPLIAIAIALNVLRTGAGLLRRAVGGLMDEADVELLRRIIGALEARRAASWIDVHSLRAWRSGARNHIDMHLVVPRYFDVEQIHQLDDAVHAVSTEAVGDCETIVHFDPCRPRHCCDCPLPDCPVRSSAFAAREPLELEHATRADETLDSGQPVLRSELL
jgi:cation diffusion facilitator family transporter